MLRLSIHAIDRYIERHLNEDDVTWDEASRMLAAKVRTAVLKNAAKNENSDAIWVTSCGILLSVRNGTVKTVLPWGSKKTNRRPVKPSSRSDAT